MQQKFKAIFLSIVLICKMGLSDNKEFSYYRIINNPTGWRLPDINLMKKSEANQGDKALIIDTYTFPPYEKTTINKLMLPFVLNKRNRPGKLFYKEEMSNYSREWIEWLCVIKLKEDDSVICFVMRYFEDNNTAEDNYDYISGYKYIDKINVIGEPGKSRIGAVDKYIFDRDNDGIYESLLTSPPDSIEDGALLIKKIKEEYLKHQNKKNVLPNDLRYLKNAWIQYLSYPSQENLGKILPILHAFKYEKVDPNNRGQKELWNYRIQNKLDWADVDFDLGVVDSELAHEINDFWNWICQSTYELEKSVYTSDRTAVKICFKLIPFAVKNNSGRVGRILDQFIQINPQMFLEELEENYQYIRLEDVLDGNFGLELIGKADLKYLENKKKISALKRVEDPKLIRLRDQCIKFLEKELQYLRDNFYLRKENQNADSSME